MAQQTITALLDSRSDATRAADELVKVGIPRTGISLMPVRGMRDRQARIPYPPERALPAAPALGATPTGIGAAPRYRRQPSRDGENRHPLEPGLNRFD